MLGIISKHFLSVSGNTILLLICESSELFKFQLIFKQNLVIKLQNERTTTTDQHIYLKSHYIEVKREHTHTKKETIRSQC